MTAERPLVRKAIQAKHLADLDVLRAVEHETVPNTDWHSTSTMRVAPHFPDVPFKVVWAKLGQLHRRGLLDGCDCGCRGDWHLLPAGRDYLAAHTIDSAATPVRKALSVGR